MTTWFDGVIMCPEHDVVGNSSCCTDLDGCESTYTRDVGNWSACWTYDGCVPDVIRDGEGCVSLVEDACGVAIHLHDEVGCSAEWSEFDGGPACRCYDCVGCAAETIIFLGMACP